MDERLRPVGDPVKFDRYVLDVGRRRLLLDGRPIAIPARAFDLLAILISRRGGAVSRERLYELLWPRGFVEDGNLTQNVYVLRRTLDPSGGGRRFIETLPRHGYRFAMTVTPVRRSAAAIGTHLVRAAVAACFALTFVLSGSSIHSRAVPLGAQAAAAYALGVYHWNMRTPAEIALSIDYFTKTIRAAPQNPLGYAGLANAYVIMADGEHTRSAKERRYLKLARSYRDQALARDPKNAEAHTVSAFLAERFEDDPATAEREFATVFALKPDYAMAHHWHAVYQFAKGEIPSALREWELAHQLAPTSEVISRWLGIAYFYARRPDDAIAILTETTKLQPNDTEAWIQLASAQELRGRFGQALASLEQVRRTMPHKGPYVTIFEARVKVLAQRGAVNSRTLDQVRRIAASHEVDPADVAYFFAAIGKNDEAISLLRRLPAMHGKFISIIKYDPRLDSLRADPRFKKIFG